MEKWIFYAVARAGFSPVFAGGAGCLFCGSRIGRRAAFSKGQGTIKR
jgi:hypothetical protein